jgi:hypothetical protein
VGTYIITVEAVDATFGVVGRSFFNVIISAGPASCGVVPQICPSLGTATPSYIASPKAYHVQGADVTVPFTAFTINDNWCAITYSLF